MSTKQRTISAEVFYEKLKSLNACDEALEFAKGKPSIRAYKECKNPDWMLWLLGRSGIDEKVIQLIAVEFAESCAANAKDFPAVAECIAVTKRYLKGKATEQELDSARSAASCAARCAAAKSAACAARSAAWSAACSAACGAARSNQCNIIRKRVSYDKIVNLLFPERTVVA